MRALLLPSHGGPENFVLSSAPRPEPAPGRVLVRVRAVSLNHIDVRIRTGLPIGAPLPAVLGCDVAGTVEAVGSDVTEFAPGDLVWGCAGGVRGEAGTLAEFIAADAQLLAPAPKGLSLREAAALPLVGITAWEAIERTGVSHRDHVLVHAGAGGVGHVAVQLAKFSGARVAATVGSAEDAELARGYGADDIILYRDEDVGSYVRRLTNGRGFDVVIDTVGGGNLDKTFEAVGLNGRVAATAARSTHDLSPLHAKGVSLHVVFMIIPMLHGIGRDRHGRIMKKLAALVEAGKLRPRVDPTRFELADAVDAFRYFESGRAQGKVIVEIK